MQEFSPDRLLSHYRIVAKIGAGGMGEVYRAKDTRLDRDVAIKVLPADFANDVDRLNRFEQEARATSALNHPNILTVYDIGNHEGAPFIVAELLEGDELREELNGGALPVKRAIDYAQQVAAGLAAAHDKGIVHRDLKPENLFITKDGRVKILDFGLAKVRMAGSGSGSSEVATQKQMTDPGTVMGTVGYMSPEQVNGKDVDHRSDIFSFGLILYEMLAGKRAFEGDSAVAMMSAILRDDPPELSETNARISPALDKIVRRCLEKKPENRFHSAHDLGFALGTLTTPSGARLEAATALPSASGSIPARLGSEKFAWIAATAVVLLALIAIPFVVRLLYQSPSADAVALRLTMGAPEEVSQLLMPEISPDGRYVVFAGLVKNKIPLWLRPMGSLSAKLLPGASESTGTHTWSPDSRSIAFTADGQLKRMDIAGGLPQTICPLPQGSRLEDGATAWSRDGVILFTSGGKIFRVPASGGTPKLVVGTDQANPVALYGWPTFLPDGSHFLYLRTPLPHGTSELYLGSLNGTENTRLMESASQAAYVSSASGGGYLLFARGEALLAQAFDIRSFKLSGEPFVVSDKVAVVSLYLSRGLFSVSDNGSLIFLSASNAENSQLTWFNSSGKEIETVGSPGRMDHPRLSPDGKRVALEKLDPQTRTYDIFVIDLARSASSRLTFDPGDDRYATWSPDGSRIAWASNRGESFQIIQKLSSGLGDETPLQRSETPLNPHNSSPDGRFLLYDRLDPKTQQDLWLLPLGGEGKPTPFLQTPFNERRGRFSPDGHWVVYDADDQGHDEVYVQTFPASGGKWQISTNGGSYPQWRGDGKEIFYISADNKLMAVEVKLESALSAGVPKVLFDLAPLRLFRSSFAASATGDRFLFVRRSQTAAALQYNVFTNWTAEAKK